jgi:diguanylate cyclase (GGDEF)-like protein/PAS domain S-box-containing protein
MTAKHKPTRKPKSGLDIAARTESEQAQRRMDELFRALVENALDIITIIDPEGFIRYETPSVERVLGYEPAELIGVKVSELLHPDDVPRTIEYYKALKVAATSSGTAGIGQVLQARLRHKDGSWRNLEGVAQVLDTPSVTGIVINCRDVTERSRVEEKLQYLSTHDTLTGLYNRAYFEVELARIEPSRQFPVSLLMVDVDGLKATNDRQGHAAGDSLLRRTAQVLMQVFRVEDVVARIGGDEFAVLLPEADAAAAAQAVDRIRSVLSIHNRNTQGDPLGLSVGAATGEKGCSLAEILK